MFNWKMENGHVSLDGHIKISRFETGGSERFSISDGKKTVRTAETFPDAIKQAEDYYRDAYAEYLHEAREEHHRMTLESADKIKAVEIHIDRAEGPTRLCGSRSFFGADCWTMAHAHLCEMAKTAPDKGGYDKHDFKVVFADGETYEGRYDLVHLKKQTPDLPGHIRNFIQFLTGDFCPSHLKQADYDRCTENKATREEAKAYLKKYQIGGV